MDAYGSRPSATIGLRLRGRRFGAPGCDDALGVDSSTRRHHALQFHQDGADRRDGPGDAVELGASIHDHELVSGHPHDHHDDGMRKLVEGRKCKRRHLRHIVSGVVRLVCW